MRSPSDEQKAAGCLADAAKLAGDAANTIGVAPRSIPREDVSTALTLVRHGFVHIGVDPPAEPDDEPLNVHEAGDALNAAAACGYERKPPHNNVEPPPERAELEDRLRRAYVLLARVHQHLNPKE